MRIHRDERGQTIILVALSLPILLGFVGLATDVGSLLNDKRQLQTAADAAAIAGALNLNYTLSQIQTAGKSASAANGFDPSKPGVTVNIVDGPTWRSSNYLGKTGYVEATITKSEPTIFLALFGHPSITVLARAVATNSGPPAACIYTVGDGVTPPSPGLTVTGAIVSPQCGLVVDSNASPPMNVSGTLTMKSIGTVGDCSSGCGTGTPIPRIIPYSDPLSFLPQTAPGGACTNSLNATGGSFGPLPPGCYTTFNATGANVTLSPGTYVINGTGGMSLVGSTLSGAGVTFYINSGSVTINNTTLNLSAPNDKSQPLNGILFYQSALDPSMATINGFTNSTLQGIMYFPKAPLSIVSSGSATLFTDFVAQSLSFTVAGNFSFNDYASAPSVTSSPLSSVVLVE